MALGADLLQREIKVSFLIRVRIHQKFERFFFKDRLNAPPKRNSNWQVFRHFSHDIYKLYQQILSLTAKRDSFKIFLNSKL